jgi:hypothetical protein
MHPHVVVNGAPQWDDGWSGNLILKISQRDDLILHYITTKYRRPRACINPKIYPVIYGYRQPDLIEVTTLPDLQGTHMVSKLACLLVYSLLCLSRPFAPNLPASPCFATKNEYSIQPHSWVVAQLVQPTHHNKSKMHSPLAKSSIFNEIPNPP